MSDPTPDNRNRVAYWIGRLFHPYLVCIPTLIAVLSDVPPIEAFGWLLLVISILLPPLLVTGTWLKRRERYLYQRATRSPVYLVFWVSVLVCLGVTIQLNAPRALVACLMALALWVPLQLLINTYVTKVSTHAAVAAACMVGLLLLGRLNHPLVLLLVVAGVAATLWARIVTRNHTAAQVIMGLLVGILPVLIVFPTVL